MKKLSEIVEEYLRSEVVSAGLSSKTYESYFYAAKLAKEFFGDVPIDTIGLMDITKFFEHLSAWQKPDTVRGNIICLRSILRFAKRRGLNVAEPDEIHIPKRQKREIEYLTESEVESFISVVSEPRRGYSNANRLRNTLIVELLYATGLRVGELCALNRNSIRNRQFCVVGKSKNSRPCFITEELEQKLDDYLKTRTDSCSALFISNETRERIRPGTIRRVFHNACERSDFEGVHPHTIRHSYATRMLEAGVDIVYIGQLLGHESLDTTRCYTHVTNPKLHAIYDAAMRKIS